METARRQRVIAPTALAFGITWATAVAGWFVLLAHWLTVYLPLAAPAAPGAEKRYLATSAVVVLASVLMVALAVRRRRFVPASIATFAASLLVITMLAVPHGRWSQALGGGAEHAGGPSVSCESGAPRCG